MVPQVDTDKMINLLYIIAVKVTKMVKHAMALYHEINSTRSTFYVESFMLFQEVHSFRIMPLYYYYIYIYTRCFDNHDGLCHLWPPKKEIAK